MARKRGGKGGRDEPEEVEAIEEVQPLDFEEPERPARGSRGRPSSGRMAAGIGFLLPLFVTVLSMFLIAGAGIAVAVSAKTSMSRTMDQVGVNAALALAAPELEWWESNHGVAADVNEILNARLNWRINRDRKEVQGFGQRNVDQLKSEFKRMKEEWGFTELEGPKREKQKLQEANRVRLQRLVDLYGKGGLILYVEIIQGSDGDDGSPKGLIVLTGGRDGYLSSLGNAGLPRRIGAVKIVPYPGCRLYGAVIRNRYDQKVGWARVVLSDAPVSGGGGLLAIAFIAAVVGFLIVGAISFLFCMGPAKALGALTASLDQLGRGMTDVKFRPGGGDVGQAARAAERVVKLIHTVQDQAAEVAEAAPAPVVEEGVDSSGLLPLDPPRLSGTEIEAVHKPSAVGANDYFDYIEVGEKHLGVVIADMPKEGPQGAFIATTFRALMHAFGKGEGSPAVVLSKVNRVMANELKRGDHITALYAVIDMETGILAVASAGHLPLIFWKLAKKGSALLNPEGIAIGLDKGPVFEKTVVDKRIKLEKGDRIVMFTDGPVAAKNAEEEEFGEQRFYYLVNREAPKNSAAFVNFVANEVDLFHEGAPQLDDITLVTVRKL